MLAESLVAMSVAVAVGTLPGYFWARCLSPTSDLFELLAYSIALSMALVPAAAILQARLYGTGITTFIAAVSPLAILASGAIMYKLLKPAGARDPLIRPPFAIGPYALVPLIVALGLALAAALDPGSTTWFVPAEAALIILAGALATLGKGTSGSPSGDRTLARTSPFWGAATAIVLVLVAVRGYLGPVVHDWPFIRGGDQYSHAVMSGLMISEGRIDSYLIYPPGFHTMTAIVSRLSGLEPLELFPIVAPALSVLPALACYALAGRIWGRGYGIAAAVLAGLLLAGPQESLAEARYPNILSADFLLVMAVAALVALYGSAGARSGALLAILGSSVVLYHQVGSFYLALLLLLVAALFVPFLLLTGRRREGTWLLLALGALGLLAVLFAWETYDLPSLIAGVLGGPSAGAGGTAVAIAIGSQAPLSLAHLLATTSLPVAWLGLLGTVLAVGEVLRRRVGASQALAYLTLVLWAILLSVGSRTALSGFPQRFERDLGLPLAVLGALALTTILRSAALRDPAISPFSRLLASLATIAVFGLVGLQAWENLGEARAASSNVISPEVAEAGAWLGEHNTGGNVIVTPYLNDHVPGSAMLAMGDYTGLRSYTQRRLRTPRALPPSGKEPLLAASWVLRHPVDERTRQLLLRYDVGYLVLYKRYPGVDWRTFEGANGEYRKAFENGAVIILSPRASSSEAGG